MINIINLNHNFFLYLCYLALTFFLSYTFFKRYPKISKKLGLIDNQNPNYNFNPTPTGAGIAFSFSFLIGNFLFYFFYDGFSSIIPNRYYFLISGMFLISVMSFCDDRKSLDPILRLIVQTLLVYLAITCLDLTKIPLPNKLIILLVLLTWIYILNINNFIDGSDGFCSINLIFAFFNILIISLFLPNIFSLFIVMILFPTLIMFFLFNRPVAKIYMGDSGSIGMGFILGFIFLELITKSYIGLAITLISYLVCDCSITLFKKLKRGIMPWVGMYDYYYLIPIMKDKINHKNVLILIFIYNILNSSIIYLQLLFQNQFICILSIILSCIMIYIFKNLETNLKFLKFYK